ncbi:hypothetical protein LINPERPRIM_LOCUS6610, partial [Linum perenne]
MVIVGRRVERGFWSEINELNGRYEEEKKKSFDEKRGGGILPLLGRRGKLMKKKKKAEAIRGRGVFFVSPFSLLWE